MENPVYLFLGVRIIDGDWPSFVFGAVLQDLINDPVFNARIGGVEVPRLKRFVEPSVMAFECRRMIAEDVKNYV